MILQKTNDPEFMRDADSGALINTNVAAYKLHKQQRQNRNTVENLKQDVDNLKSDLTEIKQLLSVIIENVSNNR